MRERRIERREVERALHNVHRRRYLRGGTWRRRYERRYRSASGRTYRVVVIADDTGGLASTVLTTWWNRWSATRRRWV
jgi:hypothetical protein